MSDTIASDARKALEGVTPGEWQFEKDDTAGIQKYGIYADDMPVVSHVTAIESLPDARFIAASRQLVPALADRVEALEAALIRIDALDPERDINGCSADAARGMVNRMGEIARAALRAIGEGRSNG